MYVKQEWPTYIFYFISLFGILLIAFSFLRKKAKMDYNYYSEKFSKFSNTLSVAIKISILAKGRFVTEDKKAWACVLHTKLCVTANSLLILAPKIEIKDEHWDFSSMFTLARNIMECYQTLFYLCFDNVTDSELFARKKLFNLHDYYSRVKLFSFMDEKQENPEMEKNVINELSQTDYFKKLTEKQQAHFLKGENAFFISREDIEEKIGRDKNEFKMLYKLLSSNTHSYPMGFYRIQGGERGTSVETNVEVGYSALALEISEQYLLDSCNRMLEFFPDIKNNLTEKEKGYIEENPSESR